MISEPCEATTPGRVGRDAHLRRVAAWCKEVARPLGLRPVEQDVLLRAARMHHRPEILLDLKASNRLFASLKIVPRGEPSGADAMAAEVLRALHGPAQGCRPEVLRLASVLDMCDDFDESFELDSLDPESRGGSPPDSHDLLGALGFNGSLDPGSMVECMPVFPAIAHQALRLLANQDSSFRDVERVVSSDPVLAAEVIRCANSTEFGARFRIGNLRQALSYIGSFRARQVMFSACLRPIFSNGRSRSIWNHSLQAAIASEAVAHLTGRVPPEHAFLAGLVHDVGRLAVLRARSEATETYHRLVDAGCPPTQAETALLGFTHAELGRVALEKWGFPPELVEGVAFHHTPERAESAIAATLYLAEDLCASDEDLPSVSRLRRAHLSLGLEAKPLDSSIIRRTMTNVAALRFS